MILLFNCWNVLLFISATSREFFHSRMFVKCNIMFQFRIIVISLTVEYSMNEWKILSQYFSFLYLMNWNERKNCGSMFKMNAMKNLIFELSFLMISEKISRIQSTYVVKASTGCSINNLSKNVVQVGLLVFWSMNYRSPQ